jgi:hypothetical protein
MHLTNDVVLKFELFMIKKFVSTLLALPFVALSVDPVSAQRHVPSPKMMKALELCAESSDQKMSAFQDCIAVSAILLYILKEQDLSLPLLPRNATRPQAEKWIQDVFDTVRKDRDLNRAIGSARKSGAQIEPLRVVLVQTLADWELTRTRHK